MPAIFKAGGIILKVSVYSKYVVLLLLLYACKTPSQQAMEENRPLYAAPVSYALDTNSGYTINPLTSDSILPLRDSAGKIIATGTAVPFISTVADEGKTFSSTIISPVISRRKPSSINFHPVPENIIKIPVDTNQLRQVNLGEGDSTFILRNSMGIIPTGVPLAAKGKKLPVIEAEPLRIMPLRPKDEAQANIQYLDVEQGLPMSYITNLLLDSKGNVWFGTDGLGIGKYDGIIITNYQLKETLAGTAVTALLEDRKGNIWIGSANNGITIFDGTSIMHFTEEEGLSDNHITSMTEDTRGNIWIGTQHGGVSKFVPIDLSNGTGTITHFTTKEGLPNNGVTRMMQDRQGNIWMASNMGAIRFDGKKFCLLRTVDGPGSNIVNPMLEDRKGNIWIGGEENLTCYDGKIMTRYTKRDGLIGNTVSTCLEDENGNIWIGTVDGLCKFDGNGFTHFTEGQGLTKNKVTSLAVGGHGVIWCGTEGGGINKLYDAGFTYPINKESFDLGRVRPMMRDPSGHLWFGTEPGEIYKFDGATQEKYHFNFPVQYGMRAMLTDKSGNRWFGTTGGGGLLLLNGEKFIRYSGKKGARTFSIMAIEEDIDGNIWLGCKGDGVISIDKQGRPDNEKAVRIYTTEGGLTANHVMVIRRGKNRTLWMGTEGGGLCKVEGEKITAYTEKEGLFAKTVNAITEDEAGNIWLGTIGAGVVKFDGKQFTYYSEQQGLSNNNVWSLFEDSAKRIWAGTDKGLNLFNPQKRKGADSTQQYGLFNFGAQDGLKAIDFNLHSVCVDDYNRIWWGTGKGVPTLDLNQFFEQYVPRSLSLSYIEINERFFDFRNLPDNVKQNITYTDVLPFTNYPSNLKLSHNQNHLSFHFGAIDWLAQDKIKYSYRLAELNDPWSTPSSATTADYRGLAHGDYEFQVKAIGQSQQWTVPFSYSFVILPAWWQTWWFKTFIVLAAIFLSLFISRLIYLSRLRKQKNEMEKKLAVQMERQRISAEMHDDIGAGLSGVRLLTEMTKKKVKDENTAEQVEKIYQSVGEISSKMKEVIWSLNTENDNLPNLVSYIQKQARLWLEHYPCKLSIDADDNIPDILVFGETRRNIFLLIKEAIHNIIKHSEATRVQLSFHYQQNRLIIIVADNGKGIVAGKADEMGNGMKNMQQRIRQLNGKLFIKSNGGLTINFEIPIQPTTV
jgi:ligand-binding sensor domain-containing protein/signal transduction histidine kinase